MKKSILIFESSVSFFLVVTSKKEKTGSDCSKQSIKTAEEDRKKATSSPVDATETSVDAAGVVGSTIRSI